METKNIPEKWDADLYEVLSVGVVDAYAWGGFLIEAPKWLVPPASGFDVTWIEVDDSETPSVTVRGMRPEETEDDTIYVFSNRFTQKEIYDIKQHITHFL